MNHSASAVTGPSEGELFRKILGTEWQKLHPDIQARFAKNPAPGRPLYYRGALSELSCSRFGKLLGYLTMPMIKGALIPFSDANFPVDIEVYSKPDCAFIFKQRIYRLHGRKPIQFTSYMRESEKGEVLEYVGMGLGMKLLLRVQEGNLYFTSDGYFLDVFGWRIPLPGLLTPGKTFLCHRNDSASQFNIRIEIKHAVFGTTFTQVGVFNELETSSTSSPNTVLAEQAVA
ncbi:MAG: DUF4166 domain-containing protein [Pseudomonadota bacterium]